MPKASTYRRRYVGSLSDAILEALMKYHGCSQHNGPGSGACIADLLRTDIVMDVIELGRGALLAGALTSDMFSPEVQAAVDEMLNSEVSVSVELRQRLIRAAERGIRVHKLRQSLRCDLCGAALHTGQPCLQGSAKTPEQLPDSADLKSAGDFSSDSADEEPRCHHPLERYCTFCVPVRAQDNS